MYIVEPLLSSHSARVLEGSLRKIACVDISGEAQTAEIPFQGSSAAAQRQNSYRATLPTYIFLIAVSQPVQLRIPGNLLLDVGHNERRFNPMEPPSITYLLVCFPSPEFPRNRVSDYRVIRTHKAPAGSSSSKTNLSA